MKYIHNEKQCFSDYIYIKKNYIFIASNGQTHIKSYISDILRKIFLESINERMMLIYLID